MLFTNKQMVTDRPMEGEVVDVHVCRCAGGHRMGEVPVEVGRHPWGMWMCKCVVVRLCRRRGMCVSKCTGTGVCEWGSAQEQVVAVSCTWRK